MVHQVSPDDWQRIVALMRRLFRVTLDTPNENSRGAVDLTYVQDAVKEKLDIGAAGRGFQQMLLVFAYLFSHKRSVLLVDEPDAHLEILRQKQVFVLLRDIASENGSQVVLVTHSEVILAEALEKNLTLLLDGRADNLASRSDIHQSLKLFGAEHYVRARQRGYVLYVEGGTGVDILRAFSRKLGHPVVDAWDECINAYYVENNYPDPTPDAELERVEGGFGSTPKDHFNGLRKLLPTLRGLTILDNDHRNRQDSDDGHLRCTYWRRYEIENYFVTPQILQKFVAHAGHELGLFAPDPAVVQSLLDEMILNRVFDGNEHDFQTWRLSPPAAASLIWDSKTQYLKLSAFAEDFFRLLGERTGFAMLLTKGELHRLVGFMDVSAIDQEVGSKLSHLEDLFRQATPDTPPL
jgi:hypothetical protein